MFYTLCVVSFDKDSRNYLQTPATDCWRSDRMRVREQDVSFTFGGEIPTVSCRVSALCSYSTNAFPQFVTFRSFHCDIKPEGFGCNPFNISYAMGVFGLSL